MNDTITVSGSTSANAAMNYPSSTAVSEAIPVTSSTSRPGAKSTKVENAVYGHIRALRALGRQRVGTLEIAKALGIPVSDVNLALSSLEKKGVKVLA